MSNMDEGTKTENISMMIRRNGLGQVILCVTDNRWTKRATK